MEDSIEVMLQERNSKLLSRYRDNRVLAFPAGAIFSGIYGLWAMFCLPGMKVPFRLKVPFLPSTKEQTENVMKLLKGRQGQLADLGSGDGRLTDLSKYTNVVAFLTLAVMADLEVKLLKELPVDARVVVCRFPFPHWPHSCTSGSGLDQVWAYNVSETRDTDSSLKAHP
ncbi:hypothetical protein QTP86_021246 [Hemibagrus guttatus]|nr:hypothetical protein QTP86_021246 [Hemibagrus guttatus]